VWVSEIMLQQTRVDVVVPYFARFLRRFPSVRALARAPIDAVLEAWSGLGYYRRARMLHEGARFVAGRHRGRFPRTIEEARAIPGVGSYTAGAILSIAYGVRAPIVDGNVARVLARIFGVEGNSERGETRARLWSLAETMVAERVPSTINQAMMELGAMVCVPRAPRCEECPAAKLCVARARGLVDRLPGVSARRASIEVSCVVLLVRDGDRILLRRRGEKELLAGLWDLPGAFTGDDDAAPGSLEASLAALGFEARAGSRLGTLRHQVTHRRITLEVHEASARRASGAHVNGTERDTEPAPAELAWVRLEQAMTMALAAPARKILERWGASLDTRERTPVTLHP
jgi:A/G-specific adenine glycosylase